MRRFCLFWQPVGFLHGISGLIGSETCPRINQAGSRAFEVLDVSGHNMQPVGEGGCRNQPVTCREGQSLALGSGCDFPPDMGDIPVHGENVLRIILFQSLHPLVQFVFAAAIVQQRDPFYDFAESAWISTRETG